MIRSNDHGTEKMSTPPRPAPPNNNSGIHEHLAGKLCLRDKVLAKNSVNILVRELDTADDPAVRSNALIVLGDLCVRYVRHKSMHLNIGKYSKNSCPYCPPPPPPFLLRTPSPLFDQVKILFRSVFGSFSRGRFQI